MFSKTTYFLENNRSKIENKMNYFMTKTCEYKMITKKSDKQNELFPTNRSSQKWFIFQECERC